MGGARLTAAESYAIAHRMFQTEMERKRAAAAGGSRRQ